MYFCCVQIYRLGVSWFSFLIYFTTNSHLSIHREQRNQVDWLIKKLVEAKAAEKTNFSVPCQLSGIT